MPAETIATVTAKIMRRLSEMKQGMDFDCLSHLTGVLTDLGAPSDNLGSMNVRDFFTPVGGATYTFDSVATPKYTGLIFTIQGELEEGYGTAYKGYVGKFFQMTNMRVGYLQSNSTYPGAEGRWEVLLKGTTSASDPVVQFRQALSQGEIFLDYGDYGDLGQISGTSDATLDSTRFVLQGTLQECQIIVESTKKALRPDPNRQYKSSSTEAVVVPLIADVEPGADVLHSKWTLGYIQGPLGPDGTIFDRS